MGLRPVKQRKPRVIFHQKRQSRLHLQTTLLKDVPGQIPARKRERTTAPLRQATRPVPIAVQSCRLCS